MERRIRESGLYFDPPVDGYFRLEVAPYFKSVFKGRGLCEMDFGWWDPTEKTLHLLELKDYSVKALPDNLVDDLVQKATDCLLLLGSMYYGLPHAEGIKEDFPENSHVKPNRPAMLRLTFVLKTAARDHALPLQQMRDKLKNKLNGRLELLDLRSSTEILLLDHWMAQELGVPIVPADDESHESRSRTTRRKKRR